MTATMKVTNLQNESSLTPNIVLNADGTTTIPTQSTTNLAYTGTLTGGTGVINIGSGQIYKDASGNVGIGTASPTGRLHARFDAGAGDGYAAKYIFQTTDQKLLFKTFWQSGVGQNASIQSTNNSESSYYDLLLNPSGGTLLVGTTAAGTLNNSGFTVEPYAGGVVANIGHNGSAASGDPYVNFRRNGTQLGSITQVSSTGVLYNTTSDYRLKNDPQPLTGSKDFIMALQPKKWQWWDGSGEGVGFIAHEFMEVAKHSGNGVKDAVDADDKPVYQSIQPSSSEVIANLIGLVQEQQAIITQLQADVAALKGAA